MPTRRALRAITLGMRQVSLGSDAYRRRVAAQLGIGYIETIVLGHLYTSGPITPRDIAERIGFTTGATTAVLNRAENAGYLTREPNPNDGRSLLIRLTEAGRQAMQWVFDESDKHMAKAIRQFAPADLAQLAALMSTLGEYLQNAEFVPSDGAAEPT